MSAKLPVVSGERLIKILVKKGFSLRRQSGSHVVLQKGDIVFFSSTPRRIKERHFEGDLESIGAFCRGLKIILGELFADYESKISFECTRTMMI